MPFQIDGRGDMNAFVLTSPLAGVMLLTRRQPFYPSAAHDKFFSICTAFGGYTEFGIVPMQVFWRNINISVFSNRHTVVDMQTTENLRTLQRYKPTPKVPLTR